MMIDLVNLSKSKTESQLRGQLRPQAQNPMRFFFVDKINSIKDSWISGEVLFDKQHPWRLNDEENSPIRSGVVSEAVGQLVSWLSLHRSGFKGRPVFLFASKIRMNDDVKSGELVTLEASIIDQTEDSFIFSGSAHVNGRSILNIDECGGYLMPLVEMEDPEKTRNRFEILTSQGVCDAQPTDRFSLESLLTMVEGDAQGFEVRSEFCCAKEQPFFLDHFPRQPVTPIVVINELIGETVTKSLLNLGYVARLNSVQDLKIRSFVRPDDQVQIIVRGREKRSLLSLLQHNSNRVEFIVELSVDAKRILRGLYTFDVKAR